MSVPYFVFTSGEKGISGKDWAVKFVSWTPNQNDWRTLDEKYHKTLEAFTLPPDFGLNLKRPFNEPGLLMLPWADKDTILAGVVFPYADHESRHNISLVAALLPGSVHKKENPAGVFKKLWKYNYLEDIAKRPQDREFLKSPERPDSLQTGADGEKNSIPYPGFFSSPEFESLKWPGSLSGSVRKAVLCVNGMTTEKYQLSASPDISKPDDGPAGDRGRKKYFLWLIGAALLLGTAITVTFVRPREPFVYVPPPVMQSEEGKAIEEKLERVKEKNDGSLSGLVEIFPADWTDAGSKLTRKGAAVWKESGSFSLLSLPSSGPVELLYLSQSSLRIKKDDFIADFARWLEQETPSAVVRKKGKNVTQIEINRITPSAKEFKENVPKKALSFANTEGGKAEAPSDETVETIQNDLTRYLEGQRAGSESFYFAFVFREAEAAYKIIIDPQPRDGYAQLTERYYLEPGWITVDRTKIETFLNRYISIPDYDESVHIKYENPFPSDEPANMPLHSERTLYEKFAEQMVDYAKD